MNALKQLLLAGPLNATEFAARWRPGTDRSLAGTMLLHRLYTEPPLFPAEVQYLEMFALDVFASLRSSRAMLEFTQDRRLNKQHLACAVWPDITKTAANGRLSRSLTARALSNEEADNLRRYLRKLGDDILAAARAKNNK